jgi:SSS family solute:Na+ symporter
MSKGFLYVLVLLIYFAILIAVGFVTQKNSKSSSDYHLGGRKIGGIVSALSFVAAYFSSVVIIGGGGFGYKFGLSTLWIGAINVLVGTLLAWLVLGKRTRKITKRLEAETVPEFFARRYNLPFARIFTSIIIALFMIIYNVSILKGLGTTFQVLLNIPYIWGVILSGAITLIYVAFGGYLAVVWTGFIQAIIMAGGLLILLVRALQVSGGLTKGVVELAKLKQGLVETPGIWGWPGLISYVMIVSFGVWGMPQMLARFYSIKDNKAIRSGVIWATIGTAMAFIPYLVGALSRLHIAPITDPKLVDQAIPLFVNQYLNPFSVSIFFIGVIAAGMSTFSAVLIVSSGAIIRDFLKNSLSVKLNDKQEVRWSIIANVAVGVVSMAIALKPPGLILQLTGFSWAVIASTCLAPFLLGLYWNGTTRFGVICSMVGGFGTSLIWMIPKNPPFGLHGFIPGVAVSFILLIFVSLAGKDKVAIPAAVQIKHSKKGKKGKK